MQIRPLQITGAIEFTPTQHRDERGLFMESYQGDQFAKAVGHPFEMAQVNHSVSSQGVVRGIHYSKARPGQAKYVSCPRGAVYDVVVDLRVGSPTFGQWESVILDDVDRRALYIPAGLGHGFCALSDEAALTYLCSAQYDPVNEHAVNAYDPDLDIWWPLSRTLSERDAAAPTLAWLADGALLPYMVD